MKVVENMSQDPLETDVVKQEPEWDGAGSCCASELLQSDLGFMEHTPIKEDDLKEPRNGQGALACLYRDHEVKDEMVLGPETLQPADIAFTLQENPCSLLQDIQILVEELKISANIEAPAPKFVERPVLRDGVVRLERVLEYEAAPPARSGAGCGVEQSQQRSGAEVQSHEGRSTDTRPVDESSRGIDFDPTVAASGTSHGIHPTERLNNPYIYKSTNNKNNEQTDTELKTYYCRICRNNFTHTGDKPYCCHNCEQKFKRSYQLKCQEQQKEVTVKTAKRYYCGNCEKKFQHSDQLKRIELQKDEATGETEKPYCCEKCGARFEDLSALTVHKSIHHTPRKPYSCGKCKNKFVVLCSYNGKSQQFGRFICPNALASRIFKNPVTNL